MGELTVNNWQRYGKHRLYVSDDDGMTVGWYDFHSEMKTLQRSELSEEFARALAPYLPSAVQCEPALDVEPFTDLALNRPGQCVREKADEEWQARKDSSKLRAYTERLFDRKTDERAWRRGAVGEELVGKAVKRLESCGWLALHSVPVGRRDSDIDHVVIGPGGVFTLNTKNHSGKRVSLSKTGTVWVGGTQTFYVRNSQHEAERASRLLSDACGFPVIAHGVIVVLADKLSARRQPTEVTVLRGDDLIRWLKKRPRRLDAEAIQAMYQQAQRGEMWRRTI